MTRRYSFVMDPHDTAQTIDEVDAVRNVLLLIQGIDSPLLTFLPDDYGERTQAAVGSCFNT